MKLVDKHMGALASLPVEGDAVEHGVGNDQQAGGLKLFAQVVDVEHHHALIQIDIAGMAEDVQGAGSKQFQRQRDLLRLKLRLHQQLFPEGGKGRHDAVFRRLLVDLCGAAVNDGLVLRPDAVLVDLLHQRHDKLRLLDNRIVLAVALHHIHGVEPVLAACGHMNDRADVLSHSLHQRGKLALRVADQNIIVGVEHEEGDQLLGVEGLTGAGNAKQEGRLIEQVFLVAHDKVVADGVLPKIDTALVHNLLHLEGNEHRKALGGQRPKGVDTPGADGQYRVEAIELLILQYRKLAHMFPGDGQHRLRVGVKLFQRFGGQHHRNNAQHHALVAGSEIVQKLLGLLALQLHIIGDHSGEVVVGVLAALPVGDVRFHAQ